MSEISSACERMSRVSACEATDCSYNKNQKCCAIAITIGDDFCPMCDTFSKLSQKGGVPDSIGGVGACREYACKHNKSLMCTAPSITVGLHSNHPDCKTFTRM